ncbi:MAG: DoxX family membrane protein [Chitinophagales bacterium]|nr:DoxX family membrane protein [Chitinophagales bacterium]
MKILGYFPQGLRAAIGLILLCSGILKLFPIEPFELNFIDMGIANWYTAPFIARLLVALELFLGLLLIFGFYLKRFTLNATLITLIFFTAYLMLQLLLEGNNGNCGCFGTYLQMTPLESIIKNGILISGVLFLKYFHPDPVVQPWKWLLPVLLTLSLVLPFILNPVDLLAAESRLPQQVNFPLDASVMKGDALAEGDSLQPGEGKHIIAFFSMTCVHCKSAAFKLHVMKKRHPEIPFFMVLNGKQKNLNQFFEETKSGNIPYMILLGEPFAKITGGNVPTIYWVENGFVTRKSLYISLEEQEILNWLQTP